MNKSRLQVAATLLVAGIFTLTAYQSCIKDLCKDTACNTGVCVSGKCACPTGYEGGNCEKLWSAKFAGAWHNTEQIQDSSGVSTVSYDLSVRGNETPGILLIDHMEGAYDSIVCRISNRYSFQLPAQSTPDSTFRISGGTGNIDSISGVVTLNYAYRQNGISKTAAMSWSR